MLYQLSYTPPDVQMHSGRTGWVRTIDHSIIGRVLYQLSYSPIQALGY